MFVEIMLDVMFSIVVKFGCNVVDVWILVVFLVVVV